MIEITGNFNTAKCFATTVGDNAAEQIKTVCDTEAFSASRIRIMPDVHAGKGCTIGTTMTIVDKIVPSMVGVDIGCGMYTVYLGNIDIDFEKVDEAAHLIPCGRETWEGRQERFDLTVLRCYRELKHSATILSQTGGIKMEQIRVRVKGGNLVASASRDSAYPGIDVEYVPDVDEGEQASAPRVLFEYPEDGELHALVWTDKDKEDYTHKLGFTLDETVVNKSPIEIVKKMVRDEYNAFMEKMLRQSPKDIFDNAKKVDVYSELDGSFDLSMYETECIRQCYNNNQPDKEENKND